MIRTSGSLRKIGESRIQTQDLSVITTKCHPQDRHHDQCLLEFASLKFLFWINWGSIRCKHVARWQHLSLIKARLLWLVENVFSPIKMPSSGTSAVTYKLMEPQSGKIKLFSETERFQSFTETTPDAAAAVLRVPVVVVRVHRRPLLQRRRRRRHRRLQ